MLLTDTGHLSTLDKVETIGEEHGISESNLLGSRKVDVRRAGGIEGQTTLGLVAERVLTLRVVRLHGELAIWSGHVLVGKRRDQLGDTKGRVIERERLARRRGGRRRWGARR